VHIECVALACAGVFFLSEVYFLRFFSIIPRPRLRRRGKLGQGGNEEREEWKEEVRNELKRIVTVLVGPEGLLGVWWWWRGETKSDPHNTTNGEGIKLEVKEQIHE